jgi:hypothetical protein
MGLIGLEKLLETLSPAQLSAVEKLIKALNGKVYEQINPKTDIVTKEFAENFSTRLRLHHASIDEKFNKKSFEYAYRDAWLASGAKTAVITNNPTHPGCDVTVDGVRFSLKTEGAKSMSAGGIKISKFMEARWIRECKTGEDFASHVIRHFKAHTGNYDRIVTLRIFDIAGGFQYDLWEIPKDIFLQALEVKSSAFGPKSKDGSSKATIDYEGAVAFTLRLDGSVEKVTIDALSTRLCQLHATWRIPLRLS